MNYCAREWTDNNLGKMVPRRQEQNQFESPQTSLNKKRRGVVKYLGRNGIPPPPPLRRNGLWFCIWFTLNTRKHLDHQRRGEIPLSLSLPEKQLRWMWIGRSTYYYYSWAIKIRHGHGTDTSSGRGCSVWYWILLTLKPTLKLPRYLDYNLNLSLAEISRPPSDWDGRWMIYEDCPRRGLIVN